MDIRERYERFEAESLSEYAAKSALSRGRSVDEDKCCVRTDFQRDRDRILHSKAFRRLKGKTQVFIAPLGDHYRTRLTHTLEVSQIARTISRALRLNEDLTEAIALGHDLGHTPFGHSGEKALNDISEKGFEHCVQSIRVVDRLEKNGKGLNLTWEVRDGILNHRSAGKPSTMEGKVVQLSDKIAYLNHDIDDALRAGVLFENSIPKRISDVIGCTSSQRINSMITDTILNSAGKNDIERSKEMTLAMAELRGFMFEKVYNNKTCDDEQFKVENVIKGLYEYYKKAPYEMHSEFVELIEAGEDVDVVVFDFIAGMTDMYALEDYANKFMPKSWDVY